MVQSVSLLKTLLIFLMVSVRSVSSVLSTSDCGLHPEKMKLLSKGPHYLSYAVLIMYLIMFLLVDPGQQSIPHCF